MEGAIIGRCTHNATTLSIPIFAHTSFLEVHNQVCNTFNDLASGSFELTYALPGYSSCLLKSDMDVRVLHMSVSIEKRYYVDVLVNKKSYSDANVVGQKSPTAPSLLAEGIINNDGNQYLGRYMAPEGKLYLSSAWKTFITHEGQQFEGGVEDFRLKLSMYAVEMGFTFVYVKNDKLRVTVECWKKYAEGCQWRVHASVCSVNNYFYIRRLNNDHTCSRIREHKSSMLNSKLVASVLVEKIKSKPLIKPIDIVANFKQDYGLNISYYNAWYGKEIAKTIVHGDDSASYHQLFWYIESVKKTNPGSHCVLEFDPDTLHFQRLFIAFGGCIEGFKYCRPMLFIDGTHVKNKFKGTLLAATGKNGNQGFFPLAFALVNAEDQVNWTWFLKQLADILNPQERTITFVSDRQKGLLNSVSHVFPDSPHAYCLFHLKQNVLFKYPYALGQNFRNRIVQLLNECAYAATPELFELSLAKLKSTGGNPMREFLEDLPKENWSIAFFRGSRYGEMWSNVAESYNSWISKERLLPIYQLVDGIRVKLMEMNAERCHAADKWNSHLCPEMEHQMIQSIEVGRHWLVRRSTDFVLEVHTDDTSVKVDLESRFCSCRQWQANGFPCSHAFAAIMSNEELGPFDCIEDYFTAEYYKKSYSFPIAPIPDIEKPPLSEDVEYMLKPPLTRKQPGRPRVERRRSRGETRLIKCGRCKQMGHHNKRNCTTPI